MGQTNPDPDDAVVYVGTRGPAGPCIEVETNGRRRPLEHRVRHSSHGLEWGYRGLGPADAARSILWDALGREPSVSEYQRFKRDVVARLPRTGFRLERRAVRAWACENKGRQSPPLGALSGPRHATARAARPPPSARWGRS